ncbi:DUF202 domain-containing protein [Amycolatopsis jejuensis]|uniref:DUF202 domain-containing protein n=1 Tax=Amycolatopsis jejuensis TaxID=330084 RepID=UPI000527B5E4|nr:DUF202 domain-containing protein [Amycolatopsis jejuensis]
MTARDPGLQPERTSLAWQRTGLSAAVVAVLLLRNGLTHGSILDSAAGLCAVAAMLVSWLASRNRGARGVPVMAMITMTGTVCATGVLVTLRLLFGG